MAIKFKSLYPPVCVYGDYSKSWYIIAGGKWHNVDRFYSWDEIKPMWEKITYVENEAKSKKLEVKKTYKVSGSKGNTYKVENDNGFWTCSCPAHGFGRGRDCKHIKELKLKENGTC